MIELSLDYNKGSTDMEAEEAAVVSAEYLVSPTLRCVRAGVLPSNSSVLLHPLLSLRLSFGDKTAFVSQGISGILRM